MNIHQFVKPTNDSQEMEKIGKQIWDANPEIYNERRRALLEKMLDEEMPDSSVEDKKSIFL